MKAIKIFFLSFLMILVLNSCAEMSAAMSNATANNCIYKTSVVSVYDKESGKYKEDYIHTTYNGRDVSYNETYWVADLQRRYLDYPNFGVWYATSPHTKSEYRFSTFCTEYSGQNYGW